MSQTCAGARPLFRSVIAVMDLFEENLERSVALHPLILRLAASYPPPDWLNCSRDFVCRLKCQLLPVCHARTGQHIGD